MEDKYNVEIYKINKINQFKENINIMEICGTHTHAIGEFGIREILNSNINLISGPGCPVCVTDDVYIDYIYDISLKKDVIIATYGDMLRVPGSSPSITLEKARAQGAEIKMVFSSMDAVKLAKENKNKKVVFIAIGFETTTPATAIAILEAEKNNIDNFYILSLHKIVEPIMKVLLMDEELKIHGFLLPGHVAAIIGEKGFRFIEDYCCPGVIAGFSLPEVVDAIYQLVNNIGLKETNLINAYSVLVKSEGNQYALELIQRVFKIDYDIWRGIGIVENSGYKLKDKFKKYDIEGLYPLNIRDKKKNSACSCGEVLKGKIKPMDCPLFGKQCAPDRPIGPCMVSSEGSCAAYYKYKKGDY